MTMERWADENVCMRMNREMRLLKPLVLSPPEELLEESLLNVKLSTLTADYQKVAPLTWSLLHAASSTPLQLQRNTYKSHAPSIVAIISMLSFGRSHYRSEWQRQLGLGTHEAKKQMSHERLFFWLGDQLTVYRLRSLQNIRAQDLNWWHRMEHIVALFGWLHAQIAQEDSIHKQHLTTSTGGLKHVFDLLKRKGLHSTSVQGNFYQKVCDAYYHILEAHIRDVWELVGGVDDLAKLCEKSPEVLDSLAEKIVDKYASTLGYQKEKRRRAAQQDHVFINQILLNHDLLDYVNLDDVMRTGDVGRMIDFLPRLLFRYHGGSNWKYVIEMLELFQDLLCEWPEDLREFILRYCWLANTNDGKAFLAFNMLQEHNIRDIKSMFMVYGPYTTWEYIRKISATIPTLRKVKDHVEADFNHFSRGKSHSSPEKEKDILDFSQRAKDFIALGSNVVKLQATIGGWTDERLVSRATTEIWEDPEVVEGEYQSALPEHGVTITNM
ncbi:hypothetical protein BC835DRAFT_1423644 [Cytidiella melzeri]|nr:hypothetical protein BC835DRAFT_1423644 [Cytidiella melzeri]